MSKLYKTINFLKTPPLWFIVLNFCLTLVFVGITIALLVLNLTSYFYTYICYFFAGISLFYSVYLIIIFTPKIKSTTINLLNKNKFTKRIYTDYDFRTVTFSSTSLIINVCFGTFEIIVSILTKSIWYGALGSYHLILSFTRFALVYQYYKQKKLKSYNFVQQLKTYKNTGICILVFNFALAGAIAQMILSRRSFKYAGLMIFVIATYAFYKIIVSSFGIIKAKKNKDYLTQSLRNLKFTDALVTLYAMQTALIDTFGTVNDNSMRFLNMFTGIIITLISVVTGIIMIVKSKQSQKNHPK